MPLVLLDMGEVSLRDLDRFPGDWEAERQIHRLTRLGRYLDWWYRCHGHDGSEMAQQIQMTIDYWVVLREAHQTFLLGDEWRLLQLERLRQMIGPVLYGKGWHPFLLPDNLPRLRCPRLMEMPKGGAA